ncbi:MAG: hypothetical protein KF914_16770 [Rhizobiaceae bacterium]|nr:hypothetical protein [Rhizobiaceae bacterium]
MIPARSRTSPSLRNLAFALALSLAGAPAAAQETEGKLKLELNAAQPSEKGCRLTFLVQNGLGAELTEAAFEIALFDEAGVVGTLAVLAFRDLPAGKTKVTRFDLPGADCAKISRVLVNHATQCAGPGIAADACIGRLETDSRAKIAFGA